MSVRSSRQVALRDCAGRSQPVPAISVSGRGPALLDFLADLLGRGGNSPWCTGSPTVLCSAAEVLSSCSIAASSWGSTIQLTDKLSAGIHTLRSFYTNRHGPPDSRHGGLVVFISRKRVWPFRRRAFARRYRQASRRIPCCTKRASRPPRNVTGTRSFPRWFSSGSWRTRRPVPVRTVLVCRRGVECNWRTSTEMGDCFSIRTPGPRC